MRSISATVYASDVTFEAFDLAMRLVFLNNFSYAKGSSKKEYHCNGYKVENNELFLSSYSKKATPFAYEFDIKQTIDFAWGWYQSNKKPLEQEPDTDGSTEVAWELTTEKCGVGSKDWGMFVSIKPIWFIYGK